MDGAIGTYYSQLTGKETTFSEWANIEEPEIIKRLHQDYIKAGANFITTNTFSANTVTLETDIVKIKELIKKGYNLAKTVVNNNDKNNLFIGASIGPIPEMIKGKLRDKKDIINEYKQIIDTFYKEGAEIFIFETFSEIKYISELSSYIKAKDEDIFVIFQLAITENGDTRKGLRVQNLLTKIRENPAIDAFGFNCGVGPAHLKDFIETIKIKEEIVSAVPNAGYPEIINQRTVYTQNADYFAEIMTDITQYGVKMIGGCCGTTPVHINKLVKKIEANREKIKPEKPVNIKSSFPKSDFNFQDNKFREKLDKGKFVIAVELDPPFDTDISKMMEGAHSLKKIGVDVITIADSPLGRERLDSVMMASRIKREVEIETMPHVTCRDSNLIKLKSKLMAAHIERIRNLLLVTGDPIPTDRNEVVSVFNLNSYKLMKLVDKINQEKLQDDSFYYGGALNLNVPHKEKEWKRLQKKIKAGGKFFLTQPIFEAEVINFLKKQDFPDEINILGGVLPLVSYKNALFLNNEFPGINIPDKIIEQFKKEKSENEEKLGVKISLEIINKIKNIIDGIYLITPFNRVRIIEKIISSL